MTTDSRLPVVVHVDHSAQLSGAEIAMSVLASTADRFKHVVLLGEHGDLEDRLAQLKVPYEVAPLGASVASVSRNAHFSAQSDGVMELKRYAAVVNDFVRTHGGAIVHSHSAKAHLITAVARPRMHAKLIHHVRDRVERGTYGAANLTALKLALCLAPDAIVANSNATMRTIPRISRARRRLVAYSPVLPPTGPATNIRQRNPMTFSMVARLAPWKGQREFVEAFALAFGKVDGVKAQIVGGPLFGEHAYVNALRERIRALGLADRISFTGHVPDVYTPLKRSQAMVHCSQIPEPFGQVIVQSMMCGVPVIASGEGGPAEVITNHETGYLYTPRSISDLAATLSHVYKSPDEAASVATAAKQRSQQFEPPVIAEQVQSLYRDLVGRP